MFIWISCSCSSSSSDQYKPLELLKDHTSTSGSSAATKFGVKINLFLQYIDRQTYFAAMCKSTVLPAKRDSEVMFCLDLFS